MTSIRRRGSRTPAPSRPGDGGGQTKSCAHFRRQRRDKRWVLKFDDPKRLAQIDDVFVTIEPDAHSNTPRGRQVLFAYLNISERAIWPKLDPMDPSWQYSRSSAVL